MILTQEDWIEHVMYARTNYLKMSFVFIRLLNVPIDVKVTDDDWAMVAKQAQKLKPAWGEHDFMGQEATAWIAKHFPKASNMFFDGKIERAKNLLLTEKRQAAIGNRVHTKIKDEEKCEQVADKKLNGGKLFIVKVRERDNRTNWKVVK